MTAPVGEPGPGDLRGLLEAQPRGLYAVADGGFFNDLPKYLKRAGLISRPLYLEGGGTAGVAAGPHLVEIPADPEDRIGNQRWDTVLLRHGDPNVMAAKQHRAAQRKLIRSGNIMGAFMLDVADTKSNFGDKYDEAIAEAMAYLACLKKEGKVK